MNADIKTPVNRLLRGIASQHVETTRDAWRVLLTGGETSTAAVLDKLDSTSWEQTPRGPSGLYFGILLAALHELNPKVYKTEIEKLQTSKLHALHRKTLSLLQARASDHPVGNVAGSIPVYVAENVTEKQAVLKALTKWSQTVGHSLENVTRIDVIAEDGQQDYLGRYSLYFSGIILVWPNPSPSRLMSWLLARRAEHTFYHEVGHHISGHLEGGSVAEQEKEADAFALKMICRAYPVMKLGVYVFFLPVKFLVRWFQDVFIGEPKRERRS